MMVKRLIGTFLLGQVAACATVPPGPAEPTVSVQAKGETQPVGTAAADAADDPAIWRNPADPSASLIVGTDKKAGLYVYGLDGRQRSFLDAGRVNNVDLRGEVGIGGQSGILVAASDRSDVLNARVALFRLDPSSGQLAAIGKIVAGGGEAYGLCLYRAPDALFAFLVLKDGTIRQIRLDLSGAAPAGTVVRTLKLATQAEGCAVDETAGQLYVAEEDRGVWRFGAAPDADTTPHLFAAADGRRLVADVEGVAVAPALAGGVLMVSSQGDSAYAVFRLRDGLFLGRFNVAAGLVGSTEETDGIDLSAGDFGPSFPGGLLVVQDGQNAPAAQNFKLVSWNDVVTALKLAPELATAPGQ